MKFYKILAAGIMLIAIVATLASCGKADPAAKTQTYTVGRGTVSTEITAAGNLAFSTIQDLSFNLFSGYTNGKGTVSVVNVAVGDTVTKGEVLASLDQSEWDTSIQSLQDALTTAQSNVQTQQRNLVLAQRQVTTQQQVIIDAQNQIASKLYAVQQAQLNLQTAQYNLSAMNDIKTQQDEINWDNTYLDIINQKIAESLSPSADPRDYSYWMSEKARVTKDLAAAQKELAAILAGDSINITTTVELQILNFELAINTATLAVTTANQTLQEAYVTLNNAQDDLSYYQQGITTAQTNLDIASQKAQQAQTTLSEAQAASPDIIAPFDGVVTQLNVAGGDQVLSGAVAIQVADPSKFQASILVSEKSISQVKVGSTATITADAISGVTWSANVTQIAPTATIQSGVVNYAVQVEVGSIIPTFSGTSFNGTGPSGNFSRSGAFGNASSGTAPPATTSSGSSSTQLPSALQSAVDSGRITQQQAEAIMNRLGSAAASGNFTLPGGGFFSGQSSISASTSAQLRDGMTVTISITTARHANVIVVPNGAITTQGGQSYVEVIGTNGALEKTTVQTGLSDYSYTEITSGLTEGQKISVAVGASTASSGTSTTNRGGGGGIFFGR